MPELNRKPVKANVTGIDLAHPVDMMPDGFVPYMYNCRSVVAGTVQVRPGYSAVGGQINSGAPLHTIRRMNNLLPGATAPTQLFLGSGTDLVAGPATGAFSSIASGFSGNPLSSVIFRPDQSPEPWIYIADQNKMVKASNEQVVRNVGIAPPNVAPTPEINSILTNIITDCTSASGWSDDGTVVTGAPSVVSRVPASTIVANILYDTGTSGWATIVPQNNAGNYAFLQPGCRLILNAAETVTVTDVTAPAGFPQITGTVNTTAVANSVVTWVSGAKFDGETPGDPITINGVVYNILVVTDNQHLTLTSNAGAQSGVVYFGNKQTTISAIQYDSGTTGACSVVLTIPASAITRNSIVLLGTTDLVRVISTTTGPDGTSSFRCVTLNPHVAGDIVRTLPSFRAFTTTTISDTQTITGNALQFTLTKAGTGYVSLAIPLNLSEIGSRPLQPDDYMHISLRMDVPGNMVSGQLMLDVDSTTNDFAHNYYYKNLSPSDLQANTTGTLNSTVTLQSALNTATVNQQAALSSQEAIKQAALLQQEGLLTAMDPGSAQQIIDNLVASTSGDLSTTALSSAAVASQLDTGTAQWTELLIKLSDLVRVGTDATVNLANVAAIRVSLVVTAATVVDFSAWWVGGTYGPDVQQGSPVGIQYQYRYRDSRTGAKSVPGPASRYQLFPLRQLITVGVTASSDPQVDTIDIQRFDPSLAALVYVGSVPNTTGSFNDDTASSLIAGNPALETNVFQPWPVLDVPKSGVVNVSGTSISLVSGDQFQTALIPGTVILIGNDAVQIYGQPHSGTFLELVSNLGALTNATYSISSPTLLGQPLPVMFGPLEGPTAIYSFGIGDLRNPGTMYWSNGNDLDSASDQNTIEITSPSEPLISGCVWQTLIFVASAKRVFLVTPSFGTSSTGAGTIIFTATELTSITGSFSPWAMTKGQQGVYLQGLDGHYMLNYNGASYFSQQVYPLFPHDGQAASATNGYNPVTMTTPQYLRMAYCDSFLMFDYQDSTGAFLTMEIDTKGNYWPHNYADPALTHYWEETTEGVEPRMLMGTNDGYLMTAGGTTDNGTALVGTIRTPSLDFGDPRMLKLFMDMMTDVDAAGGYGLTLGFNNYSILVDLAAQGTVSGRRQYLNSISSPVAAGLILYRNIAAQYALGAGSVLYEFEPSYYSQPFYSNLYTTQLLDHGIPGWKQLRFGRIALISQSDVTIQVLNDDGVLLNNFRVPSSSGILFNSFAQLANASKGRMLRYTASSPTEFVLFVENTTVRIKKWGGPQFVEVQPFLQ